MTAIWMMFLKNWQMLLALPVLAFCVVSLVVVGLLIFLGVVVGLVDLLSR
jgi:hypothetical protein